MARSHVALDRDQAGDQVRVALGHKDDDYAAGRVADQGGGLTERFAGRRDVVGLRFERRPRLCGVLAVPE